MKLHRSLLAVSVLAMLTSGCAYYLPTSMGGEPRMAEAVADPKVLRKQADEARDAGNPDLAYRYLALIQTQHPDTPESAAAFPEAARLFKYLYNREAKLGNYDSIWTTSEPYFVFRWLEQFATQDFPQEQMDLLFLRSRYSLFRAFQTYSANRAVFLRWEIQAPEDNGIIESVTARPRNA